jgi:hypothetical protein
MLHRRKRQEGGGTRLRSPSVCSRRRRRPDKDELRTWTAAWLRTAVAAWSEQARQGGARRFGQWRRSGQNDAVGTPARGPNSAFNALEQRGAWQPRGNGALPGGPGAARGV